MKRLLLVLLLLIFTAFQLDVFAQFKHELRGSTPWTAVPNIQENDFRFVVIGDLTGGEEPGKFDVAIQRINELSPDFVITVGDLIEGYTYDRNEILRQWEAVQTSVEKLEMPFFFVPGNHDITNAMMMEVWKEKFGHDHYTFKAGETLFLILNVYDPENDGFSQEQQQMVEKSLEQLSKEHPVFVVLHDPLWNLIEKEFSGAKKISELLQDYNVTWFCGHEHRYWFRNYNAHPHYMLAGLASSYHKQDPKLGLFQNLMQVSVKEKQIRISNLHLDGLLPPDIVNDNNIDEVALLQRAQWVSVVPSVAKSDSESEMVSKMIFRNTSSSQLQLNGSFAPLENIRFEPESVDLVLAPMSEQVIPVVLKSDEKRDLSLLKPSMQLTATMDQKGEKLSSSKNAIWIIDKIQKSKSKTSDMVLEAVEAASIDEDWDWEGDADAQLWLGVAHDKKYVYIEVAASDDRLVNVPASNPDLLQLFINADTSFGAPVELLLELKSGSNSIKTTSNVKRKPMIKSQVFTKTGKISMNIRLPRSLFPQDVLRLNISYKDVDVEFNMDQAVLWLRPSWGSKADYPQSGVFLLTD